MFSKCPFGISPSDAEHGLWYHGTAMDVREIVTERLMRPASAEFLAKQYRNWAELMPIEGRVYLTRRPRIALAFALLQLGHEQKPVYLLEINGADLVDVEPDEDVVGGHILTAILPKVHFLALAKLRMDIPSSLMASAPRHFDKEAVRTFWVRVCHNLGLTQASLGKRVLAKLSPAERRLFLSKNIAHVGPVPVAGVLQVPLPFDRRHSEALLDLSYGLWRSFYKWADPVLERAVRIL